MNNLFTIHKYDIPVKNLHNCTGDTIYLIPFGDIHRFSNMCHGEKWLEFLSWAKKKKNCYFLGMGDYDDLISASERKGIESINLHDSTRFTLDELYQSHCDEICNEISFMKGKLIGLLEGNHFGTFQSSITTTQYMCQKLNCKYLGVSSFIRLNFIYGEKTASVDVWAHHGRGAARLHGTSLNKVEQMLESAEAQIFLCGHDHKKSIGIKSRLVLDGGKGKLYLTNRKILFARTGSFLIGYKPDESSYIAQYAATPTDLGVVKIEFTPKRKKYKAHDSDFETHDTFYIDIHGSL